MMTRRLLVKGKVQGVFYRVSTEKAAARLGISGWVRNTEEGDVEILCSGEEQQLQEFINWCRQGPPAAKVTSVDVTETDEKADEGFHVIRRH